LSSPGPHAIAICHPSRRTTASGRRFPTVVRRPCAYVIERSRSMTGGSQPATNNADRCKSPESHLCMRPRKPPLPLYAAPRQPEAAGTNDKSQATLAVR
jgi:hypothetical protein